MRLYRLLDIPPIDIDAVRTMAEEGSRVTQLSQQFSVDDVTMYIIMKINKIKMNSKENYKYREAAAKRAKQADLDRVAEYDRKKEVEREGLWNEAASIYGKNRPEPRKVTVGEKFYYDYDEVKWYERCVHEIFVSLHDERYGPRRTEKVILPKARCVDLSAMRLHRGMDAMEFSTHAKIPYEAVRYYECTSGVIVPDEITDHYMKVLGITQRELKKIKECLSGKRKTMFEEEHRQVPESMRAFVFKRDGGKCSKCNATEYLHIHHRRYFSEGGSHEARNLMLLCIACHALEHKGETVFNMLKAKAQKLGVVVNG